MVGVPGRQRSAELRRFNTVNPERHQEGLLLGVDMDQQTDPTVPIQPCKFHPDINPSCHRSGNFSQIIVDEIRMK